MPSRLNIDVWDWVNPETGKVVKLRRGDEVPAEVLDQEGIDLDELTKGPRPIILKDEDPRQTGTPTQAAVESQKATPKNTENK